MKKMRVAIIGQGRSGNLIHGAFFQSQANEEAEVVAVVDRDAFRRNKAKEMFDCDVYEDYQELFGRTDIDLVVNATYSHYHYPVTRDLLIHGFNVLCEKPFAGTYAQCYDLINLAKKRGLIVTAFHQTLFAPNFKKAKEVLASGKIGKPVQISMNYNGFARRWDWQTLQCCMAGSIYNTAPHPIGQCLDLMGWKDVRLSWSNLKTVLTSGDAEDYGKLILENRDGVVADIEVNAADAFPNGFVIKVCGTKGTFTATGTDYKVKYADAEFIEKKPLACGFLADEEGKPVYCRDDLVLKEETGELTGGSFNSAVKEFYSMLRDAVMDKKPLRVTPEMAAEVVRVIEASHGNNPLPVTFTLEDWENSED